MAALCACGQPAGQTEGHPRPRQRQSNHTARYRRSHPQALFKSSRRRAHQAPSRNHQARGATPTPPSLRLPNRPPTIPREEATRERAGEGEGARQAEARDRGGPGRASEAGRGRIASGGGPRGGMQQGRPGPGKRGEAVLGGECEAGRQKRARRASGEERGGTGGWSEGREGGGRKKGGEAAGPQAAASYSKFRAILIPSAATSSTRRCMRRHCVPLRPIVRTSTC